MFHSNKKKVLELFKIFCTLNLAIKERQVVRYELSRASKTLARFCRVTWNMMGGVVSTPPTRAALCHCITSSSLSRCWRWFCSRNAQHARSEKLYEEHRADFVWEAQFFSIESSDLSVASDWKPLCIAEIDCPISVTLTLLSPLITTLIFKTGFERLDCPCSNVFGRSFVSFAESGWNRRLGIGIDIVEALVIFILTWDIYASWGEPLIEDFF